MITFKDKIGRMVFISTIIFFLLTILIQLNSELSVIRYTVEILTNMANRYFYNFHELIRYLQFFLHLDYYMIWLTNLFQLLLIFIFPISGVLFGQRLKTIFKLEIYRLQNKKRFMLFKIFEYSLYISLGIYIGYLIFFFIGCFICPIEQNGVPYRTMFCDIVGMNFYFNHRQLYWFTEGTIRFLFIPFVYTSFSCILALVVSKPFLIYFIPILYWYGGTALGFFVHNFNSHIYQYLSPSLIMASGGLVVNTLYIFLPHLLIILISFLLFKGIVNKYEF